jgi:general secretion pathway protein I
MILRPYRFRQPSAFTLLEVLIAVAIFGMAVVMFSQMLFAAVEGVQSLKEKHDYNADVRFVRRYILTIDNRDKLEDGGEISTITSGKAAWSVEIEPTALPDVMELKIKILFAGGDDKKEESFENSVYVLRHNLAGPENNELEEEQRKKIPGLRGSEL